VDVFPYTITEIEAGQPLAVEAQRTGKVVWEKKGWHQATP
jgi:hypothetical protein